MDAVSLVSQLSGFLYTVGSFVVLLSIIVAVHEYGHYIVGRWCGIHPEVFSLGFGPVLASRVDKRGTRWQVAAFPFGGFVKFLGDADAASGKDTGSLSAAEQDPALLRKTMHGAPLWARSATVAAGPIFNFILSIVIFTGVILVQGQMKDPLTVGELRPLPDQSLTLRPGDEIKAISGLETPAFTDQAAWSAFEQAVPVEPVLEYRVLRDGAERIVRGPYLSPSLVTGVAPRSAASDAGLREGDVIQSVDGDEIFTFGQLKEKVEAGNGAPLTLGVWNRDGEREVTLTPRRTDEPTAEGGFATHWRIGIAGGLAFEPASESISPLVAVGRATTQIWVMIEQSLSGLKHIITGQISTCNLSGPVAIAEVSGTMASQGAMEFILLIAALSTGIGLLNLFPVPVLDGGHLVFFAYEAVTGKAPNDRAMQVLMMMGLALVLGLMLFSVSNDILFC
ncbi:RIP metalloprotease RseP [Epibacterium sp. Ofav1-8]|uniref:RIP metalloprotease RseP n=1 Tax=Epibacterium sp. Ofav1-8 TaxID=2917735 RepID=UPI001EF73BB4|nr:RIP metalloprotease RseP [Epibacterium sp. Ofav1-8]MCG7623300.1 RIP metalloprotease RseP [Epibacterium sp. Ofav1-8]